METPHTFSRASAVCGGLLFLCLLFVPLDGVGLREYLLLFAPLVLVPLALPLVDGRTSSRAPGRLLRRASILQPVGALGVVISFGFDADAARLWSFTFALPWLLVTALVALHGLTRLLNHERNAAELCIDVGLVYLVVGGMWLAISRTGEPGAQLSGFSRDIVFFTGVHFHYAGFLAPLLTGLAGKAFARRFPAFARLRVPVACGVILGPPLLACGIVFSPVLEVVAAFFLAISLWGLAILVLAIVVTALDVPVVVRGFFAVSAASLLFSMSFAGAYAVGEFVGKDLVDLPRMVSTHGVANVVGFALCSLLAWHLWPDPQTAASSRPASARTSSKIC